MAINEKLATSDKVTVSLVKGKPQSAWVRDLALMHEKFGVNPIVEQMDSEKIKDFLQFRIGCLQEELDELKESKTADDAVDALIDLCVFAIGTLDAFKVNSDVAWDRVHAANIVKEPGIKEGRPNKYGFPDLTKPAGWQAPSHLDNVGLFAKVYE